MQYLFIFLSILLLSCTHWDKSNSQQSPRTSMVTAHRGASGDLPEHTLEAYLLAIEQGADFIEPDLVMTKDGVLIARHENDIADTTNVAEVYPERKKTKIIDGQKVESWFTEDFSWKEIQKLRAKQRLSFREQKWNDSFSVPSFEQVLQLLEKVNQTREKKIGIYPETKHPTYFAQIQLNLEPALLALLKKYGYLNKLDQVIIQSFETSNLKDLNKKSPYKLAQLIDEEQMQPYDFVIKKDSRNYKDLSSENGLKEIKQYADIISLYKKYIYQNPLLVASAKKHGLKVHTWTLRAESQYVPEPFDSNMKKEFEYLQALGVDGVFTDNPVILK